MMLTAVLATALMAGGGADEDDTDGVMLWRRAASMNVVAAIVVVAVAVTFLPSCPQRIRPWGKLAYPTVGIVPRQFPPGSVCVPYRLRPAQGPNPPYPTLCVGGIGLMKGTPGIVGMVSFEVVLRLVTFLLIIPSSNAPFPIHDAIVVTVVGVHLVPGATLGVTTTLGGGRSRQERRLGGPGVRHRRRAPGLTRHGIMGGQLVNVVAVMVTSMMMYTTTMSDLVGVMVPNVGRLGHPVMSGIGVTRLTILVHSSPRQPSSMRHSVSGVGVLKPNPEYVLGGPTRARRATCPG